MLYQMISPKLELVLMIYGLGVLASFLYALLMPEIREGKGWTSYEEARYAEMGTIVFFWFHLLSWITVATQVAGDIQEALARRRAAAD